MGEYNNSVYQKFFNPSWQAIFSFQVYRLYIVASFVKFYT